MWKCWTLPTRCAGLCAPSPPSPAPHGRAGCPLPTWTGGSRYRMAGVGSWDGPLGPPTGKGWARDWTTCNHPPFSHQLSPEWGPTEAPEFPGEAVSEDEYKTRLR